MGCDAHAVIEVPSSYGPQWSMISMVQINRNYDAFGVLFGVRGGSLEEGYFDIRGVPDNVSFMLRDKLETRNSRLDEQAIIKDSQGDERPVNIDNVDRSEVIRYEYENAPYGHNHTWILAEELEELSMSDKTGRKVIENRRRDQMDKDDEDDEVYRDVVSKDWLYAFESCIRAKEIFGNARLVVWFSG